MWWIFLITLAQLLCGGWVVPAQSREVSRPIRHTLPPELESGLFGSLGDGGCSSTNNDICEGTSVLNDGILPALSGVSSDPASQWANELFTMRRSGTDDIVLSVEVPNEIHDRMELSVFNCPQLGIYAPQVVVYTADSLKTNLLMVANVSLPDTSCDYLWNFCVLFSGGTSTPNLNLVFPYQNNSNFVFLGEVTFLNDPVNDQCNPPELITMRQLPTIGSTTINAINSTTSADRPSPTNADAFEKTTAVLASTTISNKQSICQSTAITVAVSVIVTALIVAVISFAIHIAVYQCFYKPRLRSFSSTAVGGESQSQMEGATGESGDAIVYDVVDERVGTKLEMRENEGYSVNKGVGGGLNMEQNEAYDVVRAT